MSDNEIIKALESCSMHDYLCPNECPFNSEERDNDCKALTKYTLDLINRQKAEIEKLEIELKAMRGAANSYKAEVERLKHEHSNAILTIKSKDSFIEYLKEYAKERKIEEIENRGIKKFWKRLKAQNTMDRRIISVKSGDNLVKEMTEGNQ